MSTVVKAPRKGDQSGSQGEKGQMDISPAFISNGQTSILMEPGKGSLDNPAVFSKMCGTLHPRLAIRCSIYRIVHACLQSGKLCLLSA